MSTPCPKCQYERNAKVDDPAIPLTVCPNCGVVYHKYNAVRVRYKKGKEKESTGNKYIFGIEVSKKNMVIFYSIMIALAYLGDAVNFPKNKNLHNTETFVAEKKKHAYKPTANFYSRKDTSYSNAKRGSIKITIPGNVIPDKSQLRSEAIDAWNQNSDQWQQGSVFIYVNDMSQSGAAYAVAEFDGSILVNLTIYDYALDIKRLESQ